MIGVKGMKRIKLIVISVISAFILMGCSTQTITEYKLITPDIQLVQKPQKPNIKNVQFGQSGELITLTTKSYENLMHNLTEILIQTKGLESVIEYYEDSISNLKGIE